MKLIDCGIFPYTIQYYCGRRELSNVIKTFEMNEFGPHILGRFFWDNNTFGIWIRNKRDHASIAHEVCHAVNKILQEVGIPLSDETDEVYAYLTQHIIAQIYKVN